MPVVFEIKLKGTQAGERSLRRHLTLEVQEMSELKTFSKGNQ